MTLKGYLPVYFTGSLALLLLGGTSSTVAGFGGIATFISENILTLLAILCAVLIGYLYTENRETQKTMKRIMESRDFFVDIISHDLLNSITVIRGVIEMMDEEPRFGGAKKEIDTIKRHAERLEDGARNIARYAKLEIADKGDLEPVDVTPIIEKIIRDLKLISDEKNITIENKIKGRNAIKAAPFIKDLFYSMISNTVKYCPRNTKITISVDSGGIFIVETPKH